MKKIILVISLIIGFTSVSVSQTPITEMIFQESVALKVNKIQSLIGFDDQKSQKIKEVELNFLLDVQKAETCFLCNTTRKINKLKATREKKLQEILDRDEYVKYHSIENDLINENNRLWLDSEN